MFIHIKDKVIIISYSTLQKSLVIGMKTSLIVHRNVHHA